MLFIYFKHFFFRVGLEYVKDNPTDADIVTLKKIIDTYIQEQRGKHGCYTKMIGKGWLFFTCSPCKDIPGWVTILYVSDEKLQIKRVNIPFKPVTLGDLKESVIKILKDSLNQDSTNPFLQKVIRELI